MPKRRRYYRRKKNPKQQRNSVDRISNLPIEIIREIHFRLPRIDAVKTSILSKKWQSIWASHPRIFLDEIDFGADYSRYSVADKPKRDSFLTYLIKSLEIRQKPSEYNCDVDKLCLRMTVENSPAELLVNKWISFALENSIKRLCLSLKTINRDHYYLCGFAFCAHTLVHLIISDCEITNCSFKLPALKVLFLFVVCIEDDDFKDLIAGCPLIEQLRIQDTKKLRTIVVSNPNLEFFGVHLLCSDGKIRVESPNLHSIEFISFSIDMCEVEIASTTTVRELTLRDAYDPETLIHFIEKFPLLEKLIIDGYSDLCEVEITSKPTVRSLTLCNINDEDLTLFDWDGDDLKMTWMNFIDNFPLLEKLIIDTCSRLQKLHISQPNLVSLVLKDSIVKWEARINSPKLKSFEYKGGLTDFTGIEDLQELEFVLLYLDPLKLRDYYYSWFRDMLESCARSKHLSLICDIEEVVLIPVEVTDILPVNDITNLELEIISRHGTFEGVIDDFTWILPDLKTLSLTLGSTTKFFQFRREEDGELSAEEVHKPKPDKSVSILRNNKLLHIIGNEIGG
ncbi:F-box/FBD/LRR-repeat protein At1g13570-like [Solanum lycopersicum]|uniref:F-box/FBD/LRR-repeat protein At1g13570-like n=1 Tax=Solanum lycopersicum TaxID=4081 RepID=UPI000532AAEE|nr:F-box/FBD/LRR-repeat protein At1g13570-like isoform X1 [Solanum lycopersicum]